jgi:polar amino acid transport system substrate-binding protein
LSTRFALPVLASLCLALSALLTAVSTPDPSSPPFVWGGDAEGGAPYVEADPADPTRVRGFDVEVAETIARGLGRTARFQQVQFQSIDASVERGDFDIGLSGVEDTPARRAEHAVTIPYFEFREVLAVRSGDMGRFRTLGDLKGRRVGTLAGTIAYETLVAHRTSDGLQVVSYDDDVHPYTDLAEGRLDAVLLDNIIAERSLRRVPGLAVEPEAVSTGRYVGVLARRNAALRDRIDAILRQAMRDGTLEAIYRRWNIWDDSEKAFLEKEGALVPASPAAAPSGAPPASPWAATVRYLPALLAAAGVTLILTCLAMALAVAVGCGIAVGRIYGGRWLATLLTGYVELVRGTPVLLQLFVLYYGLAAVIRLPAFAAALLGLGLNYAAYESEIYRGALLAVSRPQLEAARTLGFSEWLIFRLVRGPQALRLALAPMTNDFVALLKDSSLVSVITVVELTKETAIFATNIGSWVIPGILCAALYLVLSLPLSRLARRLERRWSIA